MINVGDHHDLVLHVVLINGCAITANYRRGRLLSLVQLPAVEPILQLILSEGGFHFFFQSGRCGVGFGLATALAALIFGSRLQFLLLLTSCFLLGFVFVLCFLFAGFFSFLHVFELPFHVVVFVFVVIAGAERQGLLRLWPHEAFEVAAHEYL